MSGDHLLYNIKPHFGDCNKCWHNLQFIPYIPEIPKPPEISNPRESVNCDKLCLHGLNHFKQLKKDNQMTLIVGVLSKDGLVIGSDGLITMTTFEKPTIVQKGKKLKIINDKIIYGMAGNIGLNQMFCDAIEKAALQNNLYNNNSGTMIHNVRKALVSPLNEIIDTTNREIPLFGNSIGANVRSFSIAGTIISEKPILFHLNEQLIPEIVKPETPFITMGAGQEIADSFMANINRIFYRDSLPALSEAITAIIWTIDNTIKLSPNKLGHPIQIIKLELDGCPEELSNDDIDNYSKKVTKLENKFFNNWKKIILS